MHYSHNIKTYIPINEQEAIDQEIMLSYIHEYPHNILTRENKIAHITSSGFIIDPECEHVLLIHHNIRNTWAWTGGHVDGDTDFLAVAIKEAKEETGIEKVTPLSTDIASIDILPVFSHQKRGVYVNAHLHLSVAYILICDKDQPLHICQDENSGVEWVPITAFTNQNFDSHDVYLYNKLINKAKLWKSQ